ncbi:MAG: carbohydrate-binding domain-containing protein [Anaeroplasma sp.]|uniref:carbohydrate-binding domain-containing protein n=1 Tax=Anaeroplasma sp. TaxID=1872523 RepID=UPI002A911BEF|nr:carbohydrate-binding domain-containing protein [Anaeroplasma sp.]MDY5982806.1 carbohydrate-binding domain-containing protein [Anaeroplasma sp.]
MKKNKLFLLMALALALVASSCGNQNIDINPNKTTHNDSYEERVDKTPLDAKTFKKDITEPFSIETLDGIYETITDDGGMVYKIIESGLYSLKGALIHGRIEIDGNIDVLLELNGVKITNSYNAPIFAKKASSLKVRAMEDTYNEIIDERNQKESDNEAYGEAAIYAKCDLKISGRGSLVIEGGYNNAIASTDDLYIKNIILNATSIKNCLRGNDSVTIESGDIIAISIEADGIKSDNSDVSFKNNQHGTIHILGGTIYIDAFDDGIDSAYDVDIFKGVSLSIQTGHVEYSSRRENTEGLSYKGIKASNGITIYGGTIKITSLGDSIHANGNVLIESISHGGLGDVTIHGGYIDIYSLDDGIHADGIFTINGGNISITNAIEGVEANIVNVNGGDMHILAKDDGINATYGKLNPVVNVTGGILDIMVFGGDVDGIDSNGSYIQEGGIVVSRAKADDPNGKVLDVIGDIHMTKGTFIGIGSIMDYAFDNKRFYDSSLWMDKGTYSIKNTNIKISMEEKLQGIYIASNDILKITKEDIEKVI